MFKKEQKQVIQLCTTGHIDKDIHQTTGEIQPCLHKASTMDQAQY